VSIKEVEKVHAFAAQQKLFIILHAAYYLYGTLYLLVGFWYRIGLLRGFAMSCVFEEGLLTYYGSLELAQLNLLYSHASL
jgi:hypothetical protein